MLKNLDVGANPKGGWVHSDFMAKVKTCKEWGYRPSAFGLCSPDDDLSLMQALEVALNKMASYEHFLERKEQDKLLRK